MAARPQERRSLEVARDWHGPSPKRFNGWEPSYETTYEYDDDGRLVRSVTRQIEPEYDDATRNLMEGLALHDDEKCPGCGFHKSILDDPERHRFTFDERVCEVCKAQDTFHRMVARADEVANKLLTEAPPNVPRRGDGRHLYLRPLTPAEIELTKGKTKSKREG